MNSTSRLLLPVVSTCLLGLRASAQDPLAVDAFSLAARERVVYGEHEDGALSALGATYKAGFAKDGASFTPIFGAGSKSFPVTFHLAEVRAGGGRLAVDAIAVQRREGDRVVFDRGSLVEVYDLAAGSLEQSFVFADRIEGDLVLSIAVETELTAAEKDDGLVFSSAFGSVLYGRATAIDARGRSTPAETTLEEGGIRIRVDAAFVDSAAFPLTIDPTVTNLDYHDANTSDGAPDVSFDEDTGRFLIACERIISSTDHDVVVHRCDSAGAITNSAVLDPVSTQYWAHPAVANQDGTNKWLVVAEVGAPTGGARLIHGRTVSPQNFAIGSDVTISVSGSGDNVDPDVGGDPSSSSRSFCVVWQRIVGTQDSDIFARLVDPDGTLPGSTIVVESSLGTRDTSPAISKGNRFLDWNVVWSRSNGSEPGIWAAQIHFDGTLASGPLRIDGSLSTGHPAASSPRADGTWLLVYDQFVTSNQDIVGRLMNGLATLDLENLSSLLGGGIEGDDQYHPHVDADDHGFVVAFESVDTSHISKIATATITPVGSSLQKSEGPLLSNSTAVGSPRASTLDSAGNQDRPARAIVVWQHTDFQNSQDVQGRLYDLEDFTAFCFPGEDGVAACPCFNPPQPGRGCDNSSSTGGARLTQTGTASVAADTAVLKTSGEKPTALSVVFQGNGIVPSGVAFGQGVRCVGTSLKRLYKKSAVSGVITVPEGAELTISARSAVLGVPISAGTTRYYYVVYRDASVLGGCPATSTFNSTNAGAITWRP